MKLNVLVTGSSGLIGSRFLEKYGDRYRITRGDLNDGFDILGLDQEDESSGDAIYDAVVHLAAFTDVSKAYSQNGDKEGLCYRLNVDGTGNIVDLANRHGAHLIHISTDFVFDGADPSPIDEQTAPAPIEWYGETKAMAEEVVKNQADHATMMRIAFPYHRSEGVRPDLVATIVKKLRNGEPLHLFGDQLITPTFADDVVDAISRFIEHRSEVTGECYHVMGPESMSPFELGKRLAGLLGLDSPAINETSLAEYLKKDPRPRQQYLAMDTSKYQAFCHEHDFAPPHRLEDVFALTPAPN